MAPKRVTDSAAELPIALTPLLGRERELDETTRLLASARLLTITGAGGSGKTRLALELARRTRESDARDVAWLDLAAVSDPELLPEQLLTSLRLREAPDREAVDVIVDALRDTPALLVFDNCEHIVDACAALAEQILRACPDVSILTTSREALGIHGEQTWLVPPLAQPDATQLFIERARAVNPSFHPSAAVEQICRRLDGIPLAIELAAARVKVLSVEQIAERLDDAFRLLSSGSRTVPRHRTIRETIDWSYRLLEGDEQSLLQRLSVFAGSFSIEAVEAIGDGDVLDVLSALVDKSLVMRSDTAWEPRYRLLETVRQFAADKFASTGEREPVRARHAQFVLRRLEDLEPQTFAGPGDALLTAKLDEDLPNIRAVFDWCEQDASRAELELRMLYAFHWYWFARGHFHEARRRITTALMRARKIDAQVRAKAQIAAGHAASWQADWKALRPMMDESVAVLREGGDLRALASAQTLLAIAVAFGEGDAPAARALFDEAEATARAQGRDIGLCLTLYWSGLAAELRDELGAARARWEEAHQIGLELHHRPALGHSMTGLGHLALRERKYAEAIACFRNAIDPFVEVDDRWGLTQVVEGIGLALMDIDDPEEGTRLMAAAEAAWLQLGARPARDEEFERRKDSRMRQALSNDRLRVVLASGAAMPYEAMIDLARKHVARLSEATPSAPAPSAKQPALRVRALGPFELAIDGEAVDAASQSARSRELLLFLLCHRSGSTKEQIGAALWPDAEPSKLRNNFHVTLHRLRKALGNPDWIVVKDETYALDRKLAVDFDAETFEKETTAAMRSLSRDPEALSRLAQAVALYRGDFFDTGTDGEWHEDLRDRLRHLYGDALNALGRASMAAGDYDAAIDAYQRLVTLDDLDEEAARNLMLCHAKRGDAAAATRAYRRLVDTLKRELAAAPEAATVKLHEKIAAGQT